MSEYQLYLLDDFGTVRRTVRLACRDDEHALEVFARQGFGGAMELWQDRRLLDRIEAELALAF